MKGEYSWCTQCGVQLVWIDDGSTNTPRSLQAVWWEHTKRCLKLKGKTGK